jgi:probable poly-beta-1,6-N-acetyl-D-glucosamine export protein
MLNKNIHKTRIIALFGILFLHFSNLAALNYSEYDAKHLFFVLYVNSFKYATIVFFIIAGYLYESNSAKYKKNSFIEFILKKTKNLLYPYLIIYIIPELIYQCFIAPKFGDYKYYPNYLQIIKEFIPSIFFTNYWFVPVLFIYFIINYFIEFNSLKKIFFFISIPLTIFYSINIYTHWIYLTNHTTAIPGFLTFFILGRLFSKEWEGKIKTNLLVLIFIISFILSNTESYVLLKFFNSDDSFNSLRISNIFYSIFAFLFLLKILANVRFPNIFLSINYFFIYLIHPHLIRIFSYLFPLLGVHKNFFDRYWISNYILTLLMIGICLGIERLVFWKPNIISSLFISKNKTVLNNINSQSRL